MPNLLIHLDPQQGYNNVFQLGEYQMKLTRFGIVRLAKGSSLEADTGEMEAALVILGGKLSIKGNNFAFDEVGKRRNVFDGTPHTIYLPRRTSYTVTALTDVDYALNESPVSRDTARPCVIAPEQTRSFAIGRDNFTRAATVMIDEKFDSEHFYIGEGMIPSGNWSGYPPHRHDFDNLPDEIDMEETYFYRFDPAGGFGIQKVYQPDGSIDETYTVKNNDTVAIAKGFHPLCGAPGYRMYYLWTMTGKNNRGLISLKDPAHSWVK
ncbi:MAG: 5-deoxy-glucuronate isomerase [Victivallaceae bacterium]|nr:5-deoxy-glucuronate isomerase [Victivallaceae bacterium]